MFGSETLFQANFNAENVQSAFSAKSPPKIVKITLLIQAMPSPVVDHNLAQNIVNRIYLCRILKKIEDIYYYPVE